MYRDKLCTGSHVNTYRRFKKSINEEACSWPADRASGPWCSIYGMPPKLKYAEGEKVLCYHGPLLYEAKVTKCQIKDKVPHFYVHYSGWNKTWDECVMESRVLKYSDANLLKQKELQSQYPDKRRPKKRDKPVKREGEASASTSRRKRTRQELNESSTREPTPEQDVKIEIPEALKKWLMDDWDFVSRQKQLVRLPKTLPVIDILKKFSEHMETAEPEKSKTGQVKEICLGIKAYFNAMLGSQLLYKFERLQYAEILQANPGKTCAELYGIEHLLRLFVKLGPMLVHTGMDDDSIGLLKVHFHDFLRYLESSQELFTMEYDAAPQEYHRRCT